MKKTVEYEQVFERGCGMDIHKDSVYATVMGEGINTETRVFKTTTRGLRELGAWLTELDVKAAAMESTGIYWKPIFHVLSEFPIELMVVNASHIKNVPGRKTDKADSQWICKLLISGLLKGSFIPPADIQKIRDLYRYKKKLVQYISSERNRIIRALEDANVKLSSVISDTSGVMATHIIEGLLAGRKDLKNLVMERYHHRVKASPEEIVEAIDGKITPHIRFLINCIQKHISALHQQIAEVDAEIDKYVKAYETQIELLESIPGVGREAAISIISEIGVNMDFFPSEHHLASYGGMCPGNNESAGKKKSSRTRKGNQHLNTYLVELAWSAVKTKNTYYKAKYEILVKRRGKKRALIAIGRKILCAIYHMLKNNESFKELGSNYLAEKTQKNRIEYLKRELRQYGYKIERVA
jgi:Transposase and inactivated derivatives